MPTKQRYWRVAAWRVARTTFASPPSLQLAQRPERRADLLGEQLGLFPGREVAAALSLVEVDQVGEGAPGPGLRGSVEIVVRERCDGHRERDLVRLLRCGADEVLVAVLPVQPRGRGRCV